MGRESLQQVKTTKVLKLKLQSPLQKRTITPRSKLILALAHYPQDLKEKIDYIQIQVQCYVNCIVQSLRHIVGAVPIIANVKTEDSCANPVNDCEFAKRRKEKLQHPNKHKTEKTRK